MTGEGIYAQHCIGERVSMEIQAKLPLLFYIDDMTGGMFTLLNNTMLYSGSNENCYYNAHPSCVGVFSL